MNARRFDLKAFKVAAGRWRMVICGGRRKSGPAAKHSLASFRLRMKLRFINTCLHPWRLYSGIPAFKAAAYHHPPAARWAIRARPRHGSFVQ